MKILKHDVRAEGAAKMIILAMIVTVIGLALVATVKTSADNAAANDSANSGIYGMIPLMFGLLVLVGGVVYAILKLLDIV